MIEKIIQTSSGQIAGSLLVFFCTIPWFGLPFLDSQPWPILSAILFLGVIFLNEKGDLFIKKYCLSILAIFLIAIALGFLKGFKIEFNVIRGLVNYVGVFLLLVAFHEYYKRYKPPINIIYVLNIIWLIVGILQLFVPEFLNYFVANRTTEGRGVTSLSPEPTYFAIYLFFSSWLLLLYTNYSPPKKIKIIVFVNIIAIFLLAMSTMVALYFILLVLMLLKFNIRFDRIKKPKYVIGFLCLSFATILVLINVIPGTRIGLLLKLIFTMNPIELVLLDASINARIASIILPFHGFIYNLGLPGGFITFENVALSVSEFYDGYFINANLDSKIMSWVGAMVYELGIFGIICLILIFRKSIDGRRSRKYEVIYLLILLLSAIPLAFPLIPMIIAFFVTTRRKVLK